MRMLRTCILCLRNHLPKIGAQNGLCHRQFASGISAESTGRFPPSCFLNQKLSSFSNRHASDNSKAQLFKPRHFSSALYTPLSEADHAPFVLKPEIDFEGMFEDLGELEKNLEARGHKFNVSKLLSLWEQLQSFEQEKSCIEERRANVNEDIKQLKKKGGAKKQRDKLQQLGKSLREELRHVNSSIASLSDEFYPTALKLPNKLHPAVPHGSTPKILETFGADREEKALKSAEFPERSFMTKSHPMSHAGYAYLEHDAALMELALTQWATQELLQQGFTPFTCPAMYKSLALESLGLEPESNNETYAIETNENVQYLAGVSPLNFIAYFMMSVLEVADLPYRCFTVGRSYNNHLESTHFEGLHKSFQTQKVEMCGVCENTEAASSALFTQFLSTAKGLLSNLPLHYRIVEVPSAHLLPSMYRKCAIEVWIPDAGTFSEVTSVSSCTDYISRRVKIRYPAMPSQTAAQSRKRNFPCTVHCTALDTSTILAALLPCAHQQLPEVLKLHMPQAVSS
ncbi:serine--tRNA ligase, chloroplastic/mitochondrial-like [Patiria miniata]|uniref:Serine-tRNA synthetase type1 N-terminal domain-containing protein n=1 Tax=Patiria miniata TaxID=46514 RepID=A0A913Z5Q4_PATMI|nr:serine--tRNA ligase, chloroplastic/mitochondrial-like [Patiria miniata]